jgi:WhiB family transcriptional regulator, redox-sensing transcriptional regulator
VSRPQGETTWIPVRGRPLVCRVGGCSQLATDPEVGLCAAHRRLRPTVGGERTLRPREFPERLTGPVPWAHLAACRDAPGVDFFVEGRTRAALRETERAKAVCAACRVRAVCLSGALEERFGIWGGTTPRERSRLRRGYHQQAA